jgi:hypothetical protein
VVAARLRRERIRHDRAAGRIDVNEILPSEDTKRVCGADAEHVGGGARCISGRRRRGRKLAHDPAVELALCRREPKRPLDTVTRVEDLRLSERVERGGLTVELHRFTALTLSLTTYAW